MTYLDGPSAFYELDRDEQLAVLAYLRVLQGPAKADKPQGSRKKPKGPGKPVTGRGAWAAMERDL